MTTQQSSDYIELGPDDVIREGDEYAYEWHPWATFRMDVQDGPVKVSDFPSYSYKFRRPRSVAIRDAAVELLRAYERYKNIDEYKKALREGVSLTDEVVACMNKLQIACGVTVEELRGE